MLFPDEAVEYSIRVPQPAETREGISYQRLRDPAEAESHWGVSSSTGSGWLGEVMLNPANSPKTVPASLLGL